MADVAKLKPNEPVEELLKLANAIDQFERYNRPHASRMAQLAEIMAIRIGISGADLNAVKLAALLHDVGELIMDAPAIRSEGYLDFRRRIELWRHPVIGEQQAAKRGLPRQVQLLIRWHHEWWNGAGYPDMIAGEAIPIGARIIRLTDTYDSLTASRPYREPFEEAQARAIIAASAGIEFDPLVVRIFFDIMEELDRRSAEDEAKAAPEPVNEPVNEPATEIIVEPIAPPTVEPILEHYEESEGSDLEEDAEHSTRQ